MASDRSPVVDPFHGLRTRRLVLRKLRRDDAQAFAAYRADEAIARYQSWSDFTLDDARALIDGQQVIEFGAAGAWCQVGIIHHDTGRLVGDCAYRTDVDDPRQAEIGFTIARRSQRQGFAREAVTAVLDYAFCTRDLHRARAIVDVRNHAAHQLLERLGFRREATLENIWFKGAWGSEYAYALLRREWSRGAQNQPRSQ